MAPTCSWCDDTPATHTQHEYDRDGTVVRSDYACDRHTDQWLRPIEPVRI